MASIAAQDASSHSSKVKPSVLRAAADIPSESSTAAWALPATAGVVLLLTVDMLVDENDNTTDTSSKPKVAGTRWRGLPMSR